jgi:hypothetical protein
LNAGSNAKLKNVWNIGTRCAHAQTKIHQNNIFIANPMAISSDSNP